ncbi:aldehyde/L-sorbosone dehydrogenase [Acetobacter tropicalis NRIC 0312]|nr:sorbosone dehydrogenase [Acetobacter tropicalis]GBR67110.1 aldehyde/L-sorbosone dehydrogenase [Acetobacter tropicalis NRIC 0312]
MERYSPAHGVLVTKTTGGTEKDVNEAVAVARKAFENRSWAGLSGQQRADVLLKAANLIRDRAEELAVLETLETGKPITQSRGEIQASAGIYEYAAGAARMLHGDSFNNLGDNVFGLVTREPIGVVGLITPWNFPFFILSERLPFILASGCTVVAKPSDLTSATTLIMAEILTQAGLPDGVFNVVTGAGSVVGEVLSHHPDIDMLSFTGSTSVGKRVLAASAGNFKKLSLELGGKNPHVVFADARLEEAVDGVIFGFCFNAGQCCVGGSRLLVEKSIQAEFEHLLVEKLGRLRVGDPLDPETQVGAIVSDKQHETICDYIERGTKQGARLLTQGSVSTTVKGLFVQPTIFSDVTSEMDIATDEIFGPVLSILPFETVNEAITIANTTIYGLSATIWTQNLSHAMDAVRGIRAGRVWVNTTISGGPELPAGGFKQSGIGRETGIYGVEEYTEIKATHIAFGPRTPWVS